MKSSPRVLLLAGPGDSSVAVANLLSENFDLLAVIMEQKPSGAQLYRRAQRLGLTKVVGQILFLIWSRFARRRRGKEILDMYRAYGLNANDFPSVAIYRVSSANSQEAQSLIQRIGPDLIVVNGTRILSSTTLSCVDCYFLNVHMGITPKYRGVHGAYWALARGDRENCGVTVHLLDAGIDTGAILSQARIQPKDTDDIHSYPVHQLGTASPLLIEAVERVSAGDFRTKTGVGPSELFHHPTLWEYLYTWVRYGVR